MSKMSELPLVSGEGRETDELLVVRDGAARRILGGAYLRPSWDHIGDICNPHKVTAKQIGAATDDALALHLGDKGDPHQTLPGGGQPGQVLLVQPDGSFAWGTVAGVPVSQLCISTTGAPLPGTVAANVKQKFARGVYPQLDDVVLAAGGYLTDEAAWDAQAVAQEGSCGQYCLTDAHIILPCIKHYIGMAQPGVTGKEAGDWLADAVRNFSGDIINISETFHTSGTCTGIFSKYEHTGLRTPIDSDGGPTGAVRVDISSQVPTAEENRPKTSYVLPCIKVADVAVNAAQVDMMALAQQVASINGGKVDRAEWKELVPGRAYQRPDGIIEQFGTYSGLQAGKSIDILLPVTIPHIALFVNANQNTDDTNLAVPLVRFNSNSSIRIVNDWSSVAGQRSISGLWYAVGR